MLIRFLTFLLLAFAGFAPVSQQPERAGETRTAETLAPGIEHYVIKQGESNAEASGDRWTIHVLMVDAKLARVKLAQAMDEVVGAETTSSIAARHGALAAINGGYFRTTGVAKGEPVGALVIGGKVLSEPVRNRAVLAIQDDGYQVRAAVAHLTMTSELRVGGKMAVIHPIAGINRPREKDELILFTPEFHHTTLTEADGIEVIVTGNRVTAVFDGAGSKAIPNAGFVISATGRAREWVRTHLRRGSRVGVKTSIKADPPIHFTPNFILGGGPQLLSSGRKAFPVEANRYSESLYQQRHPRTAIGWRADGKLILITVDGRQKQSAGMTMDELAGLMLKLGCLEAMNLDGGGSTTMIVKNKIANNPSDATGERAVSDALLIFPR